MKDTSIVNETFLLHCKENRRLLIDCLGWPKMAAIGSDGTICWKKRREVNEANSIKDHLDI